MNKNIIVRYAGRLHKEINQALRSNNINTKNKSDIELLDIALDSLESYSNKYVYRYENITDWELMYLWYTNNLNNIICRPDYISTFKKRPSENPITLIIKTVSKSNCKDIEPVIKETELVKADMENECLFKRNTFFKILKVDELNEIVYLEETKEKSKLIFTKELIFKDEAVIKCLENKEKPTLSFTERGII